MAVSVSYAAVELARKIFGDLEGRTVMLAGAGKMSELAARHLRRSGASHIFVTNRTWERALEMANLFHGTPVEYTKFLAILPEVDIQLPLAPGMTALIKSRLTAQAFRDTILTGARIGGADALARGIVDETAPGGEVLTTAIARAAAMAGKNRAIYGALKRGMYGDVFALLDSGAV